MTAAMKCFFTTPSVFNLKIQFSIKVLNNSMDKKEHTFLIVHKVDYLVNIEVMKEHCFVFF
jgi:hypothetical protein